MPGHQNQRLIAAYEAALAIAREVTPDQVLQRIVDLAREVVPARYAALGVADEQGRIIHFITSGITPEERQRIGPAPEGHGLLGALIRDRAPLLINDIAGDPRSTGFPPEHPPMQTLLGVPILLGNQVLGNLYLAEKSDDAPFDTDDLAALHVLAAHAAAAVDRALIYRHARDQGNRLRTILDNLPAGVIILAAPEGRVELANNAARELLFGPGAEALDRPISGDDIRLIRPLSAIASSGRRLAVRALQGEVMLNQQFLLERADGQQIPVLVQAAPLSHATGAIDQAIVVLQDMTGPRAAEQLKDDFLSLISHEFRMPLTAIHGGAHVLVSQGDALDRQSREELLGDIVTESARLDRMLTNMLSVTDIMAGRMEAHTEPVLITPLAQKAAASAAAYAPGHTFVIDLPSGLPAAEGDPELLLQVLRNLYENAVKYAPDGGAIRTTATFDERAVTVEVSDEGIGIEPGQVDQVFERFHRAGGDPAVRGMGLGLYLSRRLVEVQGGTLAASSPGPGLGATFSITLPLANEWLPTPRSNASPESACASS